MYHRLYEDDDGNTVQEFDDAGIDGLIDDLVRLKLSEPGTELVTPAIHTDDGTVVAASDFILRKVMNPDERSETS